MTITDAEAWIAAHGRHVCDDPLNCDKPGAHYIPNGTWPVADCFGYANRATRAKQEKRINNMAARLVRQARERYASR